MKFDELEFETRFVAFVDIIGFEKIIEQIEENKTESQEQVERLMSILSLLKDQETGGAYSNVYYTKENGQMVQKQIGDIRTIAVSDCIVMSAAGDFEGFKELLFRVGSITTDLAIDGWFIRGAMTRGNLYHKNGIVFGTAYQKAVRLEKEEKERLGVIIDKSVSEYLTEKHSDTFPYSAPTIKTRIDGYQYLSYLPYKVFPKYGNVRTWSDYLKVVKQHIIKNLRMNNPETMQKYIWLKEDFNSTVRFFENTGESILEAEVSPIE